MMLDTPASTAAQPTPSTIKSAVFRILLGLGPFVTIYSAIAGISARFVSSNLSAYVWVVEFLILAIIAILALRHFARRPVSNKEIMWLLLLGKDLPGAYIFSRVENQSTPGTPLSPTQQRPNVLAKVVDNLLVLFVPVYLLPGLTHYPYWGHLLILRPLDQSGHFLSALTLIPLGAFFLGSIGMIQFSLELMFIPNCDNQLFNCPNPIQIPAYSALSFLAWFIFGGLIIGISRRYLLFLGVLAIITISIFVLNWYEDLIFNQSLPNTINIIIALPIAVALNLLNLLVFLRILRHSPSTLKFL